ncbi:MAG: hypothetical protein J2P25_19345 [Nocardiopsaceae bacterium]|nr:hypothetical protein [Nocardiopsaceae bacterium]
MDGLAASRAGRLAIAVTAMITAVVTTTAADPAATGTATTRATTTGTAATGRPPVTNLGQPVQRALSTYQGIGASAGTSPGTSAAVGTTPSGDPEAYFLNMGNYSNQNAEFAGVDLTTGKTVIDTRLPSGYSDTGMAYSSADHAVFMGTGEGPDLYEYRSGGTAVTDLGPSIAGQDIWALAAAPDGTIWGGTYPGGDIFSYDPATGAFHNYGQALKGETYITALLPTATGVYFGTQPDTDFGELDPGTGAVTQIPLPSAYAGQAGKVSGLSAADGRLFVGVAASTDAALVWDTSSRSWVATIDDFGSATVSPPDPSNPDDVYYQSTSDHIVRYDAATLSGQQLSWAPNAIPGAWAWVGLGTSGYPGQTLVFTFYTSDRIYGQDFQSGTSYYLQPQVQGSGDQIITLGAGPGKAIYAGAYLTPPGMARWDPGSGSWRLLTGSGQVEGYGDYDGNLVFGRYPQGDLYYYDLSKPWNYGTNPGPPVAIGDDQNRPVAFAQINGLEAVGSVPVSGRLGGDISLWNPATGALSVYPPPVPAQTPVSLVPHDGLLWGATSVNGGYGVAPTARSAELFAWNPVTHKVVFSVVPKKGAANVSGLALDSSGHLWGLADSTLFEFSLATRHVMRRETLSLERDDSMYGIEHRIVFDRGQLFATTDEKLFRVNPLTWRARTAYWGPASDLTRGRGGQLYFVQRPSYVYRYDPGLHPGLTRSASPGDTPGPPAMKIKRSYPPNGYPGSPRSWPTRSSLGRARACDGRPRS